MAMDFEHLDLYSDVKETVWLGDPAVDIDRTDVKEWFLTGEGWELLPKAKASMIRWRPLEPDESLEVSTLSGAIKVVDEIPDEDRLLYLVRHYRNTAKFGLLSFGDMALGHHHSHGLKCLDDATILKLGRIKLDPPPLALGQKSSLSFLTWIGGLISRGSFRNRE